MSLRTSLFNLGTLMGLDGYVMLITEKLSTVYTEFDDDRGIETNFSHRKTPPGLIQGGSRVNLMQKTDRDGKQTCVTCEN